MGSFSMMHWMIVLVVVMLLFGGGRVSALMGDVAKGIKSFKKGLEDDGEPTASQPVPRLDACHGGEAGPATRTAAE